MPGRPRRRSVVLAFALLAALGAGAAVAAFSNATSSSGNSFSATTIAPPSGLSASAVCTASGTVAFRNSASATGSSGALTISKPGGVVAGDVMVAQFALRTAAATINPPLNWTLVRNDQFAGGIQSALYDHVAGAIEPTTYAWTSTSSARTAGGIVAYSGVAASPIDVQNGQTGTTATPVAPTVTTSLGSSFLLTFFVARQQGISSLPGGMNARWTVSSGTGTNLVGAGASDEARASAGATGTRSASIAGSSDWTGQSVALKPPAAPQASLSWTATPSTFASGYKLQRWLGAAQENEQTVTPRTQTSAGDGPLVSSTSYTYKLTSYFGTWLSSEVTKALTTPAC